MGRITHTRVHSLHMTDKEKLSIFLHGRQDGLPIFTTRSELPKSTHFDSDMQHYIRYSETPDIYRLDQKSRPLEQRTLENHFTAVLRK